MATDSSKADDAVGWAQGRPSVDVRVREKKQCLGDMIRSLRDLICAVMSLWAQRQIPFGCASELGSYPLKLLHRILLRSALPVIPL